MKSVSKSSVLALLVSILVGGVVIGAGETTIFNETKSKAYGLKVEFDRAVNITRSGESFTAHQKVEERAIVFSGGTVKPWEDFFFLWQPEDAKIVSHKWLTREEPAVIKSSTGSSTELILGGQVQYYLAQENWDSHWEELDPLKVLRENGMDWIQVRLTTASIPELRNTDPENWDKLPDENWWEYFHDGSLEYVEQILKEASNIGMKLNLSFFLSHESAHSALQKTPPSWEGLELEELTEVVQDYCYRTTNHFKEQGLDIEIYDVGNEIQEGILGYLPGQKVPIPDDIDPYANLSYMRSKVWKTEAKILKAAIKGIKEGDSNGKITLHVAGSSGKRLIKSFFQTMVNEGVKFDYAGISFPGVERDWSVRFEDDPFSWIKPVVEFLGSLNKKVIFSEFTYPNDPSGIGGVPLPVPDLPKWESHVSVPGYPLTPSGQAKWVRDFLSFCRKEKNVVGAFYYYPDFFPGICEGPVKCYPPDEGFGLFASDTKARPALSQLRENPNPYPKILLIDDKNNLFDWYGEWEFQQGESSVRSTRKGSDQHGAQAKINFKGTGITLIHATSPDHGIAEIEIDGVCYPKIDMYSPSHRPRITDVITTNLTPSKHTLTITVSGEKNLSSSGEFIVVDGVEVIQREPVSPEEKREVHSDSGKPQLIDLEFTPKSIDVSRTSQEITIKTRVKDEGAGVGLVVIEFVNKSNKEETVKTKLCLSDGNPTQGTYSGSITFPQSTKGSSWLINRVWAKDTSKPVPNNNQWVTHQLQAREFPTSLEIRSEPVLNVCRQGCEYNSIQKAIKEADPGDDVRIESGLYSENLTVEKDMTIKGSGPEKTIITGTNPSAPVIKIPHSTSEEIINIENIQIGYAKGEEGNGIFTGGTATINLFNLKVVNNEVNGIEVSGNSTVNVEGSTFRGNGFCGIEFYDRPNGLIRNSEVINNEVYGISIQGNAEVEVVGSRVSGNGRDGIYLDEMAKATIENNEIIGNENCGINATLENNIVSCSGNSISNNKGGNLCGKARNKCR